jgi:hypothetical protein
VATLAQPPAGRRGSGGAGSQPVAKAESLRELLQAGEPRAPAASAASSRAALLTEIGALEAFAAQLALE